MTLALLLFILSLAVPPPTIGLYWDVLPNAMGSYNEAFEVQMSTNLVAWQVIGEVTNTAGLPWMSFRAPMTYQNGYFRLRAFNP